MIRGKVNSFQSLGTVDGPGVRYVVFLQGCPLRCGCCHNPETQEIDRGREFTAEEIVEKAERFKDYFGKEGGITLSGGEPILQPEFSREIFALCHKKGINTCLDTSGFTLNDSIKSLLEETDRVLLDIKYTDNESYIKYAGCEYSKVLEFLEYLNLMKIPTVIRQVIIPTLNDKEENILKLKDIKNKYNCVEKIELLPFKKLCQSKYDNLNRDFPFKDIETPKKEIIKKFNDLIDY